LRAELSDSQRNDARGDDRVVEAQRNEFDIFSPLPSNLVASALVSLGIGLAFSA